MTLILSDEDRKKRRLKMELANNKRHRENHPGIAAEYAKRYRTKCRYKAIYYYSQGTMKCACCGESHYEFLSIDHINGNGRRERKLLGHGNIAQTLVARGFPLGYRVLCLNCNMSIGYYGYCPHQKKEPTPYGETLPSGRK